MIKLLLGILASRLWYNHRHPFGLITLLVFNVSSVWQQTALRGWRVATVLSFVTNIALMLRRVGWRTRTAAAVVVVATEMTEQKWLASRDDERGKRARRLIELQEIKAKQQAKSFIAGLTATLLMPAVVWQAISDREWSALHPTNLNTAWRKMSKPGAFATEEEREAEITDAMGDINRMMEHLNDSFGTKPGTPKDSRDVQYGTPDPERLERVRRAQQEERERRRAEAEARAEQLLSSEAPRPAGHGDKPGDAILNQVREAADRDGLPPASGAGV